MKSENIKAVVEITAHDRYEGPHRVELRFFATTKAADRFAAKWNKEHCPPRAWHDIPDYYVEAHRL